ncbi:MAG: nucleotidyltransferase family protein [Candidatus Eremiobacteraeota bacterium]|nr:nucleotidyltransferase family protein [Candidatus Eremiobacteraeota bacterium]
MDSSKLAQIKVGPELTVRDGLQRMDIQGEKILFIVDEQERLIGTATDGDVRRWILGGGPLDATLGEAMYRTPTSIKIEKKPDKEEIRTIMITRGIEYLPLVDGEERIVQVISWRMISDRAFSLRKGEQCAIPVVVMAGGEGSRLSPYTRILPKALIPVGDVPIVELIIERFIEFGCDEFYLSLHHKSEIIKSYFESIERSYRLHYILEEKPMGTAGSLSLMRNSLRSTFFLSNCDILIDADYGDILKFHKENSHQITIVGSIKRITIPYGICEISIDGQLTSLVEKPGFDYFVNTGMYVLEPPVLEKIADGTVIDMTDLITQLLAENEKIGVYPVSEKSWVDIGQLEGLHKLVKRIGT